MLGFSRVLRGSGAFSLETPRREAAMKRTSRARSTGGQCASISSLIAAHLRAYPPVTGERPPHVIRRWIRDDDLGAPSVGEDDRVLAKYAAERDSFLAIHRVDEPARLPPHPFGFRLRADAR